MQQSDEQSQHGLCFYAAFMLHGILQL